MCGIVGLITGFSNGFTMDETKAFRDMLLIDTLRGFDSTGVFGVDYNGNVEVLKEASNGASFVQTTDYKAFDSWICSRGMFAVGHNRAATRGSITDKNAHPFVVEDNIVLVQNGTYKGDHSHLKNTDVDTEAVAHVLHEEPDVEKALQKINAAYAFVWYNVKEKTLNIIRNDERPLYIAYTKQNAIVFASEVETILAACSRNNITLKGQPYLLKEHMLNTWTLDDEKHTWEFDNKTIDNKYRGEPFRQYDYSDWYNGTGFRSNYRNINDTVDEAVGPDKIVTTIFEFVHNGTFTDKIMTIQEAETYRERLRYKKIIHVEMVDYKPCNNLPDCNTWYVIFNNIDPNDTVSAVFYTLIKGKSEKDIIEMSEPNPFYSVESAGTAIEHSVKGPNFERGRVLTQFVSDVQPMVIQ